MKLFKNFLGNIESKKVLVNLFIFFFILAASFPAIVAIIQPGYFPMHDDLQAMRQLQMDKCFADGQIPCRWVPDMGYGFGYPLFNYYPPLPYYIGEIIHLAGLSILDTVKVLFVLVFLLSAFSMYLLAKEFWGRLGGIISALFYVWAPYHALDVYVRGAMNESWALVFFPTILWSIYKVIKTNNWSYVILLALPAAFLTLSHLPTMIVFIPGALLWTLFWLWQEKSFKSFFKLAVSGIWALGLAAFYILPVIFELKHVHSETLFIGYFNYLAHFLNLNQLFISRFWGYGESVYGVGDTIALSLGHFHWIGTLISLFVAFKIRKTKPTISLAILFFFFWTYGYTFLTHQRAAFIWRHLPVLANLQFPWRILALSTVGTSFLAGSIFLLLRKLNPTVKFFATGVIIVSLTIFNLQFFTWREFWPWMTDQQKFSGKSWRLQQTSGIFDYLPKQLPLPPADPPDGDAKFISGSGNFTKEKKTSNLQIYRIDVQTDKATFQINTFYFPGWKVLVNNREVLIDPYRDKVNGTMIVDLPAGRHKIMAKFENTQIRRISDTISLVSWLLLIFVSFLITKKQKIIKNKLT